MGSPHRAIAVTLEAAKSRAAAWDQISRGELAFDFSQPAVARLPRTRSLKSKESVREAIIRWLEEQL